MVSPYSMQVLNEIKTDQKNKLDYLLEVAIDKSKQLKIDSKQILK